MQFVRLHPDIYPTEGEAALAIPTNVSPGTGSATVYVFLCQGLHLGFQFAEGVQHRISILRTFVFLDLHQTRYEPIKVNSDKRVDAAHRGIPVAILCITWHFAGEAMMKRSPKTV